MGLRQRKMPFELHSIGLFPAVRPLSYERYCEEIARGVPVNLGYLVKNAECRRDFETIMPGTKTIVCCAAALPFFEDTVPIQYARFCAIGDYHAVLKERMTQLDSWLRTKYPIQNSRICVDTAPVLERELAARAGLGGIGFNRMVIHPTLGSFIALGELLVDVDLMPYRNEIEFNNTEPDDETAAITPGARHCCKTGVRKCVQACPAHALTDEGYDVHKCLAYWTTQHKGVIPEPYSTLMEDVIWGCDRCQNACPRNQNLRVFPMIPLKTNPLNELTLKEILTLSARKLRMRLAGTCIADAHPYMLQRNACIVIQNTRRESQYAEELTQIAQTHPCEWVRAQVMRNH